MIYFPAEFVQTKNPGYFYNFLDKKLYSIKSGQLKALKEVKVSRFYPGPSTMYDTYYVTYLKGKKRYLTREYLESIPKYESQVIEYLQDSPTELLQNSPAGLLLRGGDPRLSYYYEKNYKIIWDQHAEWDYSDSQKYVIRLDPEFDPMSNGIYARLSNPSYTFTVTSEKWNEQ